MLTKILPLSHQVWWYMLVIPVTVKRINSWILVQTTQWDPLPSAHQKRGWSDSLVSKSDCASMKVWVQIPRTQVKNPSKKTPYTFGPGSEGGKRRITASLAPGSVTRNSSLVPLCGKNCLFQSSINNGPFECSTCSILIHMHTLKFWFVLHVLCSLISSRTRISFSGGHGD